MRDVVKSDPEVESKRRDVAKVFGVKMRDMSPSRGWKL